MFKSIQATRSAIRRCSSGSISSVSSGQVISKQSTDFSQSDVLSHTLSKGKYMSHLPSPSDAISNRTNSWPIKSAGAVTLNAFGHPLSRTYSSTTPPENQTFKKFYELPLITWLRFLSRLKLYQTSATFIMVPVTCVFYSQGLMSLLHLQYALGTATFASVMLYIMSVKIFQRTVGMLSFNDTLDTVRVSYLDFFGARKDVYVPLEEIYPLSELPDDPRDVYVQLLWDGAQHPFYVSIRYGRVIDAQQFKTVFGSRSIQN